MRIQDILALPQKDRISIMEQIWESLDLDEIQVSDEQKAELDARKTQHDLGKMRWYTLDQVRDALKQRLR